MPTKVIECRDDGLALKINGPLRGPAIVPWDNIQDVGGADIEDDGDLIPLLVVAVFDRADLPGNPWGARWVTERDLGVMAQDWDEDPQDVAEKIADFAVEAVERGRRESPAGLGEES